MYPLTKNVIKAIRETAEKAAERFVVRAWKSGIPSRMVYEYEEVKELERLAYQKGFESGCKETIRRGW